jgi:hypothetical protein
MGLTLAAPPLDEPARWQVGGESVRGSGHRRSGQANQDTLGWWSADNAVGLPLVLAVSDGHGSGECYRSHAGARFATLTAVAVMQDALRRLELQEAATGPAHLSLIRHMAGEQLPREMCRVWQRVVRQNLESFPLTADETRRIDALSPPARQALADNPFLAYGSTLLVVAVTRRFVLYTQVGDGDVLAVWPDGRVERPIPGDDRLRGNETTSLSHRTAHRDFRTRVRPFSEGSPALIMASTDGYANSFASDADFLRVGPDILQAIQDRGMESIKGDLQIWLSDASAAGSGDDITAGFVCGPAAARHLAFRKTA